MLWFKHLVCKLLTETQQADLTDKALDGTREAPPFLGNGAQIRIHIVVSSCLIIVGDELRNGVCSRLGMLKYNDLYKKVKEDHPK
jgi:hypothetical protein